MNGTPLVDGGETARAQSGWLVAGVVGLFLVYGIAVAIFSMGDLPNAVTSANRMPYLSDKPLGEDGFYMLTVAWHLGAGKGIVYNHDRVTTGIQPLATFLYGAVAWLVQSLGGAQWAFLRAVLLVNTLNVILFAYCIGKLAYGLVPAASARWAFAVGVILTVLNFGLYRIFAYGLETGMYLSLAAVCILVSQRYTSRRPRTFISTLGLGFVAGVTGLARIDFGIVLVIFLCLALIRRWIAVREAAIIGATAAVVLAPWFVWVYVVTREIVPSGGRAQSAWLDLSNAGGRVMAMGGALVQHALPWLYTGAREGLTVVALGLLALLLLVLLSRRRPIREGWQTQRLNLEILLAWLIAISGLVVFYFVYFSAGHFYTRYTALLQVVLLPLASSAFALVFPEAGRRVVWVAAAVLGVIFFATAAISLHSGSIGNPHSITARFVRDEFSPLERIGAFQSGVIGFFNPNVDNLDGKINSEALRYLGDGRLMDYINAEQIRVLVDWPVYFESNLDRDRLQNEWVACAREIPNGESVCYIRK